jgi:formamidopyrimidine-DNA glycosylase
LHIAQARTSKSFAVAPVESPRSLDQLACCNHNDLNPVPTLMPELPEVDEAAGRLRLATVGKGIRALRVLHPSLARRLPQTVADALSGARVRAVDRRGKHQLIRLADGRTLHVHFRMTGDWVFDRSDAALPRFARAAIDLDDGTRVILEDSRALSTIDVHAAGVEPQLALGPEPLDDALDTAWLRDALRRRRGAIKPTLLDQRVIAGLGNIYAAESLWRARIDPRQAAAALSDAQLLTLRKAIRAVIVRATGARYRRAGASRFDVYDREGKRCRRCATSIERITQAGRSTYFCPSCQRAPAGRRRRAR